MAILNATQKRKVDKEIGVHFKNLEQSQIEKIYKNIQWSYNNLIEYGEIDNRTNRPYTKSQNFDYAIAIYFDDVRMIMKDLGITKDQLR